MGILCSENQAQVANGSAISLRKIQQKPANTKDQKKHFQFEAGTVLKSTTGTLNEKENANFPSPTFFDIDKDGVKEMFVGNRSGRILVYYKEKSSQPNNTIWGNPKRLQSFDGKPINGLSCCFVGATTSPADINGDGMVDLLVGGYSGCLQICWGRESGFSQPVPLTKDDQTSISLQFVVDKHGERNDLGTKSLGNGHCTSVASVDWDQDGDLDLLLGDWIGGKVYFCPNIGTAKKPRFSSITPYQSIQAGGMELKIPGGIVVVRTVDMNRDGLFDLVIGAAAGGGVYYCQNTGKKGHPKFGPVETLLDPVAPDSNGISVVEVKNGLPAGPSQACYVDVIDYDQDGDLDLIVGGYSLWTKEVTEDRRQERRVIRKMIKEIETKTANMKSFLKRAPKNVIPKVNTKIEEYDIVLKELLDFKEDADSDPLRSKNYIWLYRQK